jgi:hypothetical protein
LPGRQSFRLDLVRLRRGRLESLPFTPYRGRPH